MHLKKVWLARVLRVIAAVAMVGVLLLAEFRFHARLRNTTVTYTLLLMILFFAVRWDRLESILASAAAALGFLYYFQEPAYSLKANDPQSYIAVAAFLITAIVVSQTTLTARKRAAQALERKRETERLYELGQAMLASESLQTTAWIAVNQIIPIFGVPGAAFYLQASSEIVRAGASDAIRDDALRAAGAEDIRIYAAAGVSIVSVRFGVERAGNLGLCSANLSVTVLKSIASLLGTVLERVRASEKLLDEKRVSESLLLNILPGEVADELRAKGLVSPKYFEDVTILFTDFVGFTLSTEKLAAEELVELLHDYFTAFDQIVARYRLEKMKTIGDSYMCISGLPVRNPAHPVDMVMAGFEMLHAVRERARPDRLAQWKVRIGIHTGPVIAGVVGINKFAFDIWGDTVNYSSRMESSGEASRINLSDRTYSRVKDFFACEHRGKIVTKEKRELDMYFANGILPALLTNSNEIPPPRFVRRYNVYFQKNPPAFPAFLAVQEHEAAAERLVGSSPR
jgi:class 3 adenylate cyclase